MNLNMSCNISKMAWNIVIIGWKYDAQKTVPMHDPFQKFISSPIVIPVL